LLTLFCTDLLKTIKARQNQSITVQEAAVEFAKQEHNGRYFQRACLISMRTFPNVFTAVCNAKFKSMGTVIVFNRDLDAARDLPEFDRGYDYDYYPLPGSDGEQERNSSSNSGEDDEGDGSDEEDDDNENGNEDNGENAQSAAATATSSTTPATSNEATTPSKKRKTPMANSNEITAKFDLDAQQRALVPECIFYLKQLQQQNCMDSMGNIAKAMMKLHVLNHQRTRGLIRSSVESLKQVFTLQEDFEDGSDFIVTLKNGVPLDEKQHFHVMMPQKTKEALKHSYEILKVQPEQTMDFPKLIEQVQFIMLQSDVAKLVQALPTVFEISFSAPDEITKKKLLMIRLLDKTLQPATLVLKTPTYTATVNAVASSSSAVAAKRQKL